MKRLLLLIPIILMTVTFPSLASEMKSVQEDIAAWEKSHPVKPADKSVMNTGLNKLLQSGIQKKAPKIGDIFPNGEFKDQNGKTVSLKDIIGDESAIITFYRGGWCPYCNIQLHAYQKRIADFTKLNAKLIAITPESPDNSMSTKEKLKINFTVLSDHNNAFARKLGIVFKIEGALKKLYLQYGVDLSKNQGVDSWELPLAATFVVDKHHKVHHAFVEADYTKREEPSNLINVLVKLMK